MRGTHSLPSQVNGARFPEVKAHLHVWKPGC